MQTSLAAALAWDDETKTLDPIQDPTKNLTAPQLFKDLIGAVLDKTPVGVHRDVRYLKEGELRAECRRPTKASPRRKPLNTTPTS